jgi:nitroimidazol reductase NimA-like FMN-containing flavoprotein (pyridoxamine 5'-phosphate oxidase superfamily)
MNEIQRTPLTTLKRLAERGSFDRAAVDAILDEAFICHVGFAVEGRPFVIPTSYVRAGDRLFIHGSAVSRMQLALSKGVPACVTVTLVDGLVLARSAFHHSINYRSVVIFGTMTAVTDEKEKFAAMRAFTEHIIPGRWPEVREPSPNELKATSVLSIDLNEASAKIRTGPPKDDAADYSLAVWAGELPLQMATGTPIPDAGSKAAVPDYVLSYNRKRNKS